ncbi:MAG: hypothetical protein OXT67_11390, partial [Zetaproteobacteria bacterium]|nr:hypothetical protein [Zetaproteobacteria bacterium]
MKIWSFCLWAMALSALFSCSSDQLKKLSLNVSNQRGVPIADAVVQLAGAQIGTTDADGYIGLELKLGHGEVVWLKVVKHSPTHLYSQCLLRVQGAPEVSEVQSCELYSVVKPDIQPVYEEPSLTVVDNKRVERFSSPPSVGAEQNLLSSLNYPGLQHPAEKPFSSAYRLPESQPATFDFDLQLKSQQLKVHIVDFMRWSADSAGHRVGDLSFFQTKAVSPDYLDLRLRNKMTQKAVIGAEVYANHLNEEVLVPACISNQQGSCRVLLSQNGRSHNFTIFVKSKGYRTQKERVRKGNQYVYLTPGRSLDILALVPRYGHMRGASGVRVMVGGRQVGTTDAFGVFTGGYPSSFLDQELRLHDPKSNEVVLESALQLPQTRENPFQAYFSRMSAQRWVWAFSNLRISMSAVLPASVDWSGVQRLFAQQASRAFTKWMQGDSLISTASLVKASYRYGVPLQDIYTRGWANKLPYFALDFILLPVILLDQETYYLSLAMIGREGEVLYGMRVPIEG